ncbi:unnamed protein product [Rotaria sp. Silwood2]|nr:unnamed protein product [Rotaria sp. Silwood2]CAF4486444.1 unnamed protein product [Rotaria sp. Silwood2]CAF4523977.1 unnamed protein product [Rotaria sp. Silwood2]CAF4571294.1 unnamed protein product [Rotaria sp. Silwood2]
MSQLTTANNQLVLGYWAIRGLVEPTRLLLHYTKTSFTDKLYEQGDGPVYSKEEWLSEKEKLGLDFPNLPYLFDGDLKITQSKAILYYLGRKLNLMGKTLNEEARLMMLCEEAHDLRMTLTGIFYGPGGTSKEERKKFAETTLSDHLKKFDNYFGKRSTKFAVGDQPTVADFQLFSYIDTSLILDEDHILIDKYSNIKQYLKTISELPEIKDYIVKSHAKYPVNNKVAKFGGKVIENK